jgi:hypothetical protein
VIRPVLHPQSLLGLGFNEEYGLCDGRDGANFEALLGVRKRIRQMLNHRQLMFGRDEETRAPGNRHALWPVIRGRSPARSPLDGLTRLKECGQNHCAVLGRKDSKVCAYRIALHQNERSIRSIVGNLGGRDRRRSDDLTLFRSAQPFWREDDLTRTGTFSSTESGLSYTVHRYITLT